MGILLTGMHRSGTSMLAEWVDQLGVPMAAGAEFPVNEANARGLFESLEFVALNDHWLGVLGGSWWAPPTVREQTWRSIDESDLDEARTTVKGLRAGRRKWFIKDPRISVLLPLWDRLTLTRLPVLVGLRSPREVAMSLHVRNGMTFRRGLAVWCAYNRDLTQHLHTRPSLLVDYDAALADPDGAVKGVSGFIHDLDLLDAQATSRSVESVVAGVEPALRRQRVVELDGTSERFAQDLTDHYEYLRLAHGQAMPTQFPATPDWAQEALDELSEFWTVGVERDIARNRQHQPATPVPPRSLPSRMKAIFARR